MSGLPWFKAYSFVRDQRSLALSGKLSREHAWLHVAALRYWLAEQAPTGIVEGPNAPEVIEGAACWDGERGAFVAAAVAAGFLRHEVTPSGPLYADDEWRQQNAAHVAKVERDRKKHKGGGKGTDGLGEQSPEFPREPPASPSPSHSEPPEGSARGPRGVRTGSARDLENPRGVRTGSARGSGGESRELRVESREKESGDIPPKVPHGGTEERQPETADGTARQPVQPPLLEAVATPPPRPEDLQSLWNTHAHTQFARWREMTEKRRRAAAARLRERSLAEWLGVIYRLNESPHCQGDNDRGWVADVEFFLRPDTAARALEGKYDRRVAARADTPPLRFIAWAQKARVAHLRTQEREALPDPEYSQELAALRDFSFVTDENGRELAEAFALFLGDEWPGSEHPKRPWPLSHFAKHWDRYLRELRGDGTEGAA